jgi:hypothetical protein
MSLQVLLPRDVVLRNFLMCYDNEKLPVKFQTKDGPIKERNVNTMIRGGKAGYFLPYVRDCIKYIDGSSVTKTMFDGNHQAFILLDNMLKDTFLDRNDFMNDDLSHDAVEAQNMCNSRIGHWVTTKSKQMMYDDYALGMVKYVKFMSVAQYLEDTRDSFNKDMKKSVKNWKREGKQYDLLLPDPFSVERPFRFYQVGDTVLTLTNIGKGRVVSNIMTNVHFSRVIEFFKTMAIFHVYAPDIPGLETEGKDILDIFRKVCKIGLMTPHGVGSVFKCARQHLFLRGDKSSTLGASPNSLFTSGLDGVKLKYGQKMADYLYDKTANRKSALNLANIFRIVPHPDGEMDKVFDSVEGIKECNEADVTALPHFEGIARKSIYESLSRQRVVLRARPADRNNSIAVQFANSINQTSTPTSTLMQAGFAKWNMIEFEKAPGLFDSNKQSIPVSNKSSAPRAKIKDKDTIKVEKPKSFKEFQDMRKRLKAVNDVVTALEGKDNLDFKSARTRFESVIKSHEEFESKYLANGLTIDEIPSEDLEKFVLNDSENSYTVLTEPKLGEVHKEVTRLFYMAEQELKILTQVCERFTKKVISKSSGISIVKTYRARRKEIEEMLHSHTGSVELNDEYGNKEVLYISFDMSEFSKKFPQALVRILGKIMSEISGENWMGRIDVFFRAAVVFHNTRGFMGYKSGVRGGFEGFLNFLWTLAMKVVMDIATSSTGVQGVLAVYSDDGLLRLYIDGDKVEARIKTNKIKEAFKRYGLIFHLDKTVVSPDIMEYLGLYGDEGMLIPTWLKEVMSIGKRKQSSGLETVNDKVMLWDAQCSAVVKASGPHYPSMLVKTMMAMTTLRRLNRRVSSTTLACLTVIPNCAGGFRVSSISESGIVSSIDPFSEFAADLECIRGRYPSNANAIAMTVFSKLKTPKDARKTLLTGSFLQTYIKDTSGLSIARNLVESSKLDVEFAKDPLTTQIREKILSSLESCLNIDTRNIRNLVAEVPSVIKYNKAVAIIKSSAALQFVDKNKIARAQSRDTNNCRDSISFWDKEMKTFSGTSSSIDARRFSTLVREKLYPDFSIADHKESPRVALRVVPDRGHVLSTLELTRYGHINDQLYVEPSMRFLGAQLTPEISAESAYNTEQREFDRFLSTAARLYATNPSFLQLYITIANAFRLPCPSLPSLSVTSAHRSSRNFGMNAVTTILPVPYHALINSRMSPIMWNSLNKEGRYDRTTLVESANMATYMNLNRRYPGHKRYHVRAETINYSIRNFDKNTENPVFESLSVPDIELIDDNATRIFTSTIVEENAQADLVERSIMTAGLVECIKDEPLVKAILLTRFEKWLYSCLKGGISRTTAPYDIPDPWKRDIFIEACISIGFKLCQPNIRRAVQLNLNRFIQMYAGVSVEDCVTDPMAALNYNIVSQCRGQVHMTMCIEVGRVARALANIDMDNRLRDELIDLDVSKYDYMRHMLMFFRRKRVSGGLSLPTVVINTDTHADSRMSREVRNTVREAVDSVLVNHIDIATRVNDNPDMRLIDLEINFLSLMRGMIRPSGHRNTPFNKHMFYIELLKFEAFINEKVGMGVRHVTVDDLDGFRLRRWYCDRVKNLNAVIGGRAEMTSGIDMRLFLERKGINHCMLSRANYILREIGRDYVSGPINTRSLLINPNSINRGINWILTTYNSLIKDVTDDIEIRHQRESNTVGKLSILTPVENASLIVAHIQDDIFIGNEIPNLNIDENPSYKEIVTNLLIVHSSRWLIDSYNSNPVLNRLMRQYGIFSNDGCTLALRSSNESPFQERLTDSDYTLSFTKYDNRDRAVHNYLFVNRLAGGMAEIATDGDDFLLVAILPRHTFTQNTDGTRVPEYLEGEASSCPVYNVERVKIGLVELSRALGARPRLVYETGEMGSMVLSAAYQRIVGARTTIVENDTFLVAIAELVRGGWSGQLGFRVLAMFACWISNFNNPRPLDFRNACININLILDSDDTADKVRVSNSASAVWEWFRLMNIHGGTQIDSSEVMRIINRVQGRHVHSGFPTAIYNLPPVNITNILNIRGQFQIGEFIRDAQTILYEVPRQEVYLLEDYDETSIESVLNEW